MSWLHSAATQDDQQLQNAASALVALAVAQYVNCVIVITSVCITLVCVRMCNVSVCACIMSVCVQDLFYYIYNIFHCSFRGSPPLILRTVHELQSFQSRDLHLLVPSVLSTLLESHIASLTPSPLVATHHCTCWEYNHPSTNNQEVDQKQSTGIVYCYAT